MHVLGIDIGKFKFDVCLDTTTTQRSAGFDNTEAGFIRLQAWLERHMPNDGTGLHANMQAGLHACMEATGNLGLDLAAFLVAAGYDVSIVNPAQIRAYGMAELIRNKTDRLDAALIARFCRSQSPATWRPPLAYQRELRDLVRRCDALKDMRVQELNRQQAGCASATVHASINTLLTALDQQIEAISAAIRQLIQRSPLLQRNFDLLRSINGIGEVTAALLLAELPNIDEFTPKGLAAFIGLSPQEHSSGSRTRRSRPISRVGSDRLRSALFMAALSARRHNTALRDFVARLAAAGKAPKVILIAVARKLAVFAHAVIRTQTPFNPQIANQNS